MTHVKCFEANKPGAEITDKVLRGGERASLAGVSEKASPES